MLRLDIHQITKLHELSYIKNNIHDIFYASVLMENRIWKLLGMSKVMLKPEKLTQINKTEPNQNNLVGFWVSSFETRHRRDRVKKLYIYAQYTHPNWIS